MINKEYADSVFEYRDGHLYWRHDERQRRQWNTQHAGKIAGRKNDRGYIEICMRPNAHNGLTRTANLLGHRIVFLIQYGYLPVEVDHINGDTSDNRIENLRAATRFQNAVNQKRPRNNTSGHIGVSRKRNGTYEARVSFAGERHHIGTFRTLSAAAAAYEIAADAIVGDWRRREQ